MNASLDVRATIAPCAVESFRCTKTVCATRVAQDAAGRWFITMGHAGFNLPANNRNGFATEAAAVKASLKCMVVR